MRYLTLVLLFCGCSFDLSALGPRLRDGGLQDAEVTDALVEDATTDSGEDSGMLVADADSSIEDAGSDAGTDAWVEADAGFDSGLEDAGSDSGPPLTCTSVPDISGSYRIGYRLMGCTSYAPADVIPLTRLTSCDYEFDDGIPGPGGFIFDGPCEVIIEGPTYRYECTISYNIWRYRCTLTPVSGGMNIDCRFVSGAAPPTTDPCSFFAPEA